MRWGKAVLIFQAVMTLIIGLVFLMQVMKAEKLEENQLQAEIIASANSNDPNLLANSETFQDLKSRYTKAAIILGFVSFIELFLLIRIIR